jgi:phosphate starvation-inducible PhoH-like protein
MARKSQARKTRKNTAFDDMWLAESLNQTSIKEGPRRKKWSLHDLKNIQPKTEAQRELFASYLGFNNHVVANGFPGTGKTYLSFWLALNSILSPDHDQDHIIIVRSAVPSRDIGFLPGTEKEKMAPFEIAYKDIVHDLIGKPSSYDDMCEAGKIKFMPTSFLRGLTWDNAIIIIDEIQNLTWQEIHTVMTRVGKKSRVLVCGDISQNDLLNKRNEETGIGNFLKVAENMENFDIVHFHKDDVVRSGFVRDWIIAKEDLGL